MSLNSSLLITHHSSLITRETFPRIRERGDRATDGADARRVRPAAPGPPAHHQPRGRASARRRRGAHRRHIRPAPARGWVGFTADEVREVRERGQAISSSRIRELLAGGRVNLARRMLGRPYGVEGRVVRGAERGRTIGFPTANLRPANRVVPRGGVYVTATLIDGAWRRSVTNVGVRPTFESAGEPSVETFVMDWGGDLYGDVVRVRFLHRLRDEHRFASVEELKRQIVADAARATKYFERAGGQRAL